MRVAIVVGLSLLWATSAPAVMIAPAAETPAAFGIGIAGAGIGSGSGQAVVPPASAAAASFAGAGATDIAPAAAAADNNRPPAVPSFSVVPDTTSWSLLLIGLALVGITARRRRQHNSVTA